MAPPTLIETTSFSTANPDEARGFLEVAYADCRLRVKTPLVEDGVLSVHRMSTPMVNYSEVAAPIELETTYLGREDEIFFTTVLEGSATIDRNGWNREGATEHGPGDVMLSIAPNTTWDHESRPMRNAAIGVSEALMRGVVGADPDDTSTHWDPLSSLPIPGRADIWRTTSRFLERTLNDPATADAPLVVAEAERMVATAALTVFPNTLIDRVRAPDHEGGSDILRRAVAFIESNPQADISLAEIATAAHCGPRAVQVAFRKHMDTTPMAYLRLVRLHHLREDLLAASPAGGTTVASACARWGFGSQGRCAELYRAQFGENPRDTLRR